MKVSDDATTARSILAFPGEAVAAWRGLPRDERRRLSAWAAWIGLGTVAFARPLYALVLHASEHSMHSHVVLVPMVAAYLLWIDRHTLPSAGPRSLAGALLMGAVAVVAVVTATAVSASVSHNDWLGIMAVGYISFVASGGFLFVGKRWMTAAAFPITFLVFMVPLPDAAVIWLEDALVVASADVSAWMIAATGTPMIRDGTVFTLPTIVLEVARECSGIRSSWVLFITSVAASHMFLRNPWLRVALVAFVIPLGVIRNGFRILTIALLCVRVGPHMVDSFIHHRGGPIFFALSLVPLFLLLLWLRRHDERTG